MTRALLIVLAAAVAIGVCSGLVIGVGYYISYGLPFFN